jgi:hypothetical protein
MPGGAAEHPAPDPRHLRIGVLSLAWSGGELAILQADRLIELSDELLERVDGEHLSYSGESLRITDRLGDQIEYFLCQHNDVLQTWLGVRSDYLDEFLEGGNG